MPLTPLAFGDRGRKRAVKLGLDPERLPPGRSPTVKWPVLTVPDAAAGARDAVAGDPRRGRGALRPALGRADDGYSTNLPLDALRDDDVLIVHTAYGAPLAEGHGGPARLVVPSRYLWKSAKWVQSIEVMDHDEPGMGAHPPERNGYHDDGDPGARSARTRARSRCARCAAAPARAAVRR